MTEQNQSKNRALAIIGTSILVVAVAAFAYFKWIRPGAPILNNPLTQVSDGTATPQTEPYSIGIELSDGQSQPQTATSNPVTSGSPLTPDQVQDILARLPSLQPDPNQQQLFNLPQDIIPPPQPGNVLTESFPPKETGPAPAGAEAGALKVARFSPEGDVPLAPKISVTFNQPMVPVGTLKDLSNEEVPVKISPSLPGTWRWLGTKTLTFEYRSEQIDRMPMATEYTVTVPAGVQSATGNALAETVTWKFKTPPPSMVNYYPSGESQPLAPLFFIQFDQRIDPATVLKNIKVQAGFKNANLVLATEEEIAADASVSSLSANAQEGRWLAFRATQPFPAATSVDVTIAANTPSAEGPLTTTSAQTFSFSTYSPLKIEEYRCSWYDNQCPPLTPLYIRFNNELDMSVFSEDMLKVEPAIAGMNINVYGNSIEISGETVGRTTYSVTVSGKIQDVYGQTLGQDETLKFKVDKAEPLLIGPGKNFLTLDPSAAKPVLSVYATNYKELHVKVYSVQPSDWPAYLNYLASWQQTDQPAQMPGKLVSDGNLSLNLPNDAMTEVGIDLSAHLSGNYGQLVVIVEPPKGVFESDEEKYKRFSQTIIAWIQVTQIGLDAYNDHSEMVVWATDLKTGKPLSNVQIQPNMGGSTVTTGKDGTIRFPIPDGATYLIAQNGADQSILPHSVYYWGSDPWTSTPVFDSLRWFVFDDRQMYKPGEEVHIKGWLRRLGNKQDGDVSLVGSSVTGVTYQVMDTFGNIVMEGNADVNAIGGFDFAFTLPQAMNLGYTQIYLTAQGNLGWSDGNVMYYHSIQVQEFRRPEFEVNARNETTGPYFAGDQATVAVEAKYYAGGGLPSADVTWNVTTTPGSYTPPNWDDFTFGSWTPWWYFIDYGEPGYFPGGNGTTQSFAGKTDATGTHYLNLDFKAQGDPSHDPQPYSIIAEGTVMDVNNQAWSSSTTLLVHPADVYIGLKSDSYFVEKGTPIKVDFIVTDIDGNPIQDRPVEITAGRMEYKYKDGNWVEQLADSQTCSLQSTLEPATCSFDTPLGGSYKITAIVTDEQGRKNQTQITRWVSGGTHPSARNVEQEQVTLVPDKETYQPGDTAKVLVQSPFSPAEGLLTVSRNGFLYTFRFEIKDGTTTLSIPIEEKYIPNLNIQVDLVGSAPRMDDKGEVISGAPPRPAFATGQLSLNIPPTQRTLTLTLTPDQTALEPGAQTNLNITVKDARGLPVSDAELAVVVVDESILALTNYQLADPLADFYSTHTSFITSIYGRNDIILANPQSLARDSNTGGALPTAMEAPAAAMDMLAGNAPMPTAMPSMGGSAEEKSATGQPGIVVRSDFNPLATFAPSVKTDASGNAIVPIKVPDNLTRYRIMVVAVDPSGKQFGSAESNLTARLPLMVRPSAPRFLNFGDKFELPVVLQNQTDSPMTVDVVARALNLNLGDMGQQVTIPANDRVLVQFPASTIMAGSTQIQVGATSGSYADAATVTLPVYTPATSEAFATYGVVDDGAIAQPVLYPTDVIPQYGGLEVTTSSTALQSLTDAVLYLQTYPYECSEQISSRIISVAALRDVLTAFKADGLPSAAEMESSVGADVKRLQEMQNYDGGFPYWRRGFESIPFNSIHVTHALIRAQQKGFDVPADMQENALNYLRNIESYYPSWYTKETRWTLTAYALYVRNLAGERDSQRADALIKEAGLENLSMETIGWLWSVVDDPAQLDAIRTYVNNHVVETPGAANFTTNYSDQTYLLLSSDRRTDAILLDALMEDNPQSDLIVKVVNGLMAHRSKGHWGSTQEDVFVLLALDHYFNTYEAQTPNFVARIWLGDTYAGSNQFIGRTTDISETLVPMNYVLKETSAGGGTQDLILSKDGDGRLYYRIGLQYAPTDLTLDPLDMGFVVLRTYEGVDNPDDVKQDENGVWHIKAGTRVRVKITMVADNRRYHVALVDPLPAGLEIVNPELAVSQSVPQDPTTPDYKYGWWWWGPWYEHQNMRDNRAEAFTSLLWDGVYDYSYVARATTPGTFIVPPTKAEEMYSPEVFGRSGTDTVIVE